MNHQKRCIYCGAEAYGGSRLCPNCLKKQTIIRKIRRIVFAIKRQAEQEARDVQG